MSKKYCYLFTEGNAKMRELLGGKGANLAEMTNIGLPVPQGFTITTEACTQYYEDGRQINDEIMAEIMENIAKPLNKVKLVYVGDARNNMGNSLMIISAKLGMHFVGIAPKALFPEDHLVEEMRELAKTTGAKIEFSEDIAAVDGADAIYTDVWVSMGEEAQFEERIKLLTPYRVTMDMMNMTHNPDCIFLHCLPSFHDTNTTIGAEKCEQFGITEQEVTDEVFESPASKVFDEAENRMHTIKAVMYATLK